MSLITLSQLYYVINYFISIIYYIMPSITLSQLNYAISTLSQLNYVIYYFISIILCY